MPKCSECNYEGDYNDYNGLFMKCQASGNMINQKPISKKESLIDYPCNFFKSKIENGVQTSNTNRFENKDVSADKCSEIGKSHENYQRRGIFNRIKALLTKKNELTKKEQSSSVNSKKRKHSESKHLDDAYAPSLTMNRNEETDLTGILNWVDLTPHWVDRRTEKTMSLWEATEKGELHFVINILNSGVSIDHHKLGETALIVAAKAGQVEVLKFLIEKGANIEACGSIDHWSALIHAASNGHLNCVLALIKAGANINYHAFSGTTALCEASYNGNLSCVKALVETGAEINAPGDGGFTALEEAKKEGHSQIMNFLKVTLRNIERQQKKKTETSDKTSETLISELIEIGNTEKFVSANQTEPDKYDERLNHIRTREIGGLLDNSGGMPLMREAHDRVKNVLGAVVARELESAWGYIGDWMS